MKWHKRHSGRADFLTYFLPNSKPTSCGFFCFIFLSSFCAHRYVGAFVHLYGDQRRTWRSWFESLLPPCVSRDQTHVVGAFICWASWQAWKSHFFLLYYIGFLTLGLERRWKVNKSCEGREGVLWWWRMNEMNCLDLCLLAKLRLDKAKATAVQACNGKNTEKTGVYILPSKLQAHP